MFFPEGNIRVFLYGVGKDAAGLPHTMYLHADDERRAKQVADRFAAPKA